MGMESISNAFPMHIFDMHIYMHIEYGGFGSFIVTALYRSLIVTRDTPNTLRPLNGTFRVCVIHYSPATQPNASRKRNYLKHYFLHVLDIDDHSRGIF